MVIIRRAADGDEPDEGNDELITPGLDNFPLASTCVGFLTVQLLFDTHHTSQSNIRPPLPPASVLAHHTTGSDLLEAVVAGS